jgi:hypothetical protein
VVNERALALGIISIRTCMTCATATAQPSFLRERHGINA